MKAFIAGLLLLSSINVFAMSGKTPPRNDGSGNAQCAWYDSGKKEEHGPHSEERECRERHGSCQERCFVYDQVCRAEGVIIEIVKDANGNPQRKDKITQFTGVDRDMWRAREKAERECERSYPRQDSCRMSTCYEEARRI